MAEKDELKAAAERMQTCRATGWQLEGSAYEKPSGVANMRQWTSDTRMLLTAYLDHPPLTRERVEKAVRELFQCGFSTAEKLIPQTEGMGAPDLNTWAWTQRTLTDRLCRLLGVEE